MPPAPDLPQGRYPYVVPTASPQLTPDELLSFPRLAAVPILPLKTDWVKWRRRSAVCLM